MPHNPWAISLTSKPVRPSFRYFMIPLGAAKPGAQCFARAPFNGISQKDAFFRNLLRYSIPCEYSAWPVANDLKTEHPPHAATPSTTRRTEPKEGRTRCCNQQIT